MIEIINKIKEELSYMDDGIKGISDEHALGLEIIYIKLMELEGLNK